MFIEKHVTGDQRFKGCVSFLGRGSFVGSKVHERVTDEGSKKNYKRNYRKQEIKSQSIPTLWNCEDLMVGTCKF